MALPPLSQPLDTSLTNLQIDPESLTRLIRPDVLSSDQVERLRQIGVASCPDLIRQMRDEPARTRLRQITGITDEQLLLAGAIANLLEVKGPGSIAASQVFEQSWMNVDLQDGETCACLETLLQADRSEMLSHLVVLTDDTEATAIFQQSSKRSILAVPVFVAALLVWAVGTQWSRLFPPASEVPIEQAAQALQRNLALSSLAVLAVVFGLLALGLFFVQWVLGPLGYGRVFDYLGRILLSDRDTVVLREAVQLAPERLRRWMMPTQRAPEWLALALGGALVIGALLQLNDLSAIRLMSAVFIVFVSGLTAVILVVQHQGFARFGEKWADQVRLHYVSHSVVTSVLLAGIVGISVSLVLFLASEVGLRLAVPWASSRIEQSEAAFLDALSTTISAQESNAEWRVQAEKWVAASQRELAGLLPAARRTVAGTLDTILDSTIILLVILTVLESVAGVWNKGMVAVLVPILWWLGGELIPDAVSQISSGQPLVIKLSSTALAVSLVIAILGNVLGERASQRDERECPRCFLLASKEARHCQDCGTALIGAQSSFQQ